MERRRRGLFILAEMAGGGVYGGRGRSGGGIFKAVQPSGEGRAAKGKTKELKYRRRRGNERMNE